MTDNAADFRRDEDGGALTITFTRDAKLNAVSPSMLEAIQTAVTDLGSRNDLRVLVLQAEGRYFTAGMDVRVSGEALGLVGGDAEFSPLDFRHRYRELHKLFDEMEAIEKPIVMAIQGPCLGVGVEMGSSCDFRLTTAAATFGLPEIINMAVLPGSGGISRFTRLVGPHWAKWLAMAGQTVDAQTALAMGFVHQVFPEHGFQDAVAAFARHLAGISREALGLAKLAVAAAACSDRTAARDFDRVANSILLDGPDFQKKMGTFPGR
jgi:enoyl-CoA hydratase